MSDQSSETAERRIEDIRAALDASGAEVGWHERAPDGNQPGQTEIAIKRGGQTTLVALRRQSAPQAAAWIDEVDTERRRQNADAAIAVSSSGFTEGALQKARRAGVMARDLAAVSAEEIKNWGATAPVTLVYFEFRDMEMTITLPRPIPTDDLVVTNNQGEPLSARELVIGIVEKFFDQADAGFINVRGSIKGPLKVNGVVPEAVAIDGRMRSRKYETEVPTLSTGGSGGGDATAKEPSLVLDLSRIEIPERCLFGFPLLPQMEDGTAGRVDVIGTENAMRSKVHLKYVLK